MKRNAFVATLTLLLGILVTLRQAYSQSTAATTVAFEVASVKPNKSGTRNSSTRTPNGGFIGTNVTARQLILSAYNLRGLQLTGGPGWIDSERFDIDARAPENSARDQVMAMLRTLLAERFKLVVHKETKDQPIYALILARSDGKLGPQMKISSVDCSAPRPPVQGVAGTGGGTPPVLQPGENPCGTNTNVSNTGGVMKGGSRTAPEIATSLASFVADRMVIDRTGLSGRYDFELRWTPDNLQPVAAAAGGAATPDAPSLFVALPEQMGLKLESQRGPVEFVIIDKIEKPTEN